MNTLSKKKQLSYTVYFIFGLTFSLTRMLPTDTEVYESKATILQLLYVDLFQFTLPLFKTLFVLIFSFFSFKLLIDSIFRNKVSSYYLYYLFTIAFIVLVMQLLMYDIFDVAKSWQGLYISLCFAFILCSCKSDEYNRLFIGYITGIFAVIIVSIFNFSMLVPSILGDSGKIGYGINASIFALIVSPAILYSFSNIRNGKNWFFLGLFLLFSLIPTLSRTVFIALALTLIFCYMSSKFRNFKLSMCFFILLFTGGYYFWICSLTLADLGGLTSLNDLLSGRLRIGIDFASNYENRIWNMVDGYYFVIAGVFGYIGIFIVFLNCLLCFSLIRLKNKFYESLGWFCLTISFTETVGIFSPRMDIFINILLIASFISAVKNENNEKFI